MDSLLAELQRPANAKLLQTVCDAYRTSGDDLELFGSISLTVFESLPGYHELLRQQLCAGGVAGCIPDIEVSAAAKEAAKAHFKCARYGDACQSYTRALQMLHESPAGSRDETASALYADRALSLLRLVPPAGEAAYADCTAAIASDSCNHKAWFRRALASEAAGRHHCALSDAQQAAQLMAQHSWSSPQLSSLIQRLSELPPAVPPPPGSAPNSPRRSVAGLQRGEVACQLGSESGRAPGCGAGWEAGPAPQLSVHTSEASGRYLVAARRLDAGHVLIQEDPFVAVLAKSQRSQICSVCFGAMPTNPLFCRSCPMVAYCSSGCREADVCHGAGGRECGRPWPYLLPDDARLALRLAVKLAEEGGRSASAQRVSTLEHHWGRAPFLGALPTTLLACLTFSCWSSGSSSPFGRQLPPQNSSAGVAGVTVGAVMLALGQVAVNGVAIVPRSHASASERRGLAIYPVVSMMNHTCVPAIQLDWQGRRLIARTLRELQPGDEVALSYGPQQGSMITPVRRSLLRAQYHFTCACVACEAPPGSDSALVGLACWTGGCPGAAVPSRACRAGLLSIEDLPAGAGSGFCSGCLKVCLGEATSLGELASCAKQFDAAMQMLANMGASVSKAQTSGTSRKSEAAVWCSAQIKACLEVRRRLLHVDNEIIGFTENALADSLAATSTQWLEAAAACSRSTAILRKAYPANSLPVAFQQIKYSSLLRRAGKDEAAEQQMAEARLVFKLHFGDEEVPSYPPLYVDGTV